MGWAVETDIDRDGVPGRPFSGDTQEIPCGAGGLDNTGDKLVEAALSGNIRKQADRIRDKAGSGETVLDGTDRKELSVMIQLEVGERRNT